MVSLFAPSSGEGEDEVDLLDSKSTVEHRYEASEDRAVLALACLDQRERSILHLRFFDGLTQSQIAQQVGISQMHVSVSSGAHSIAFGGDRRSGACEAVVEQARRVCVHVGVVEQALR